MDREIWGLVLAAIKRASRAVTASVRCPTFADWLIVAMYHWAVWHDRPQGWACDRGHYGPLFRPRGPLPGVSQFNRRVKTDSVRRILQLAHDELAAVGRATPVSFLDGKPLPVSPVSKDPDARSGHVTGGFDKGYKLHAWATDDGRIVRRSVTALNVHETHVAEALCEHAPPPQLADSLVLADGNYDAADLHKRVGAVAGGPRLLVPLRGMATHPVTLRQMGAARRELIDVTREHPDLVKFLLRARDQIERIFSALTSWGGGLGPLPAWVRRLARVRRWVGIKINLYHARLRVRTAAAT
jgi:hypothetical protein